MLANAGDLTIWRRGPHAGTDTEVTFPLPHLRGAQVTTRVLYPPHAGASASWNAPAGTLTVTLPRLPSACLLRVAS